MQKLFSLVCIMICLIAGSLVSADQLSDIKLSFCDINPDGSENYIIAETGNALTYMIDTAKDSPLCYTVENLSSQDTHIKVSFIDGTFTNDEWRNKACLSDGDTEYFGQYVTGYENIITLSGGTQETYTATLNYPAGHDGIYQGCLVYSVIEDIQEDVTEATNFTILMRRAKFVDMLVGDYAQAGVNGIVFVPVESDIGENLSQHPYIRIYKDLSDGKYILQFSLQNVGSFSQDLAITGTVKNFLNNKIVFAEPRIIARGDTVTINKKLDKIPPYNMTVSVAVTHQIYDTFPGLEDMDTQGQLSQKTTIMIVDTIFILTVMGLLIIGILIILIVVLSKRRRD